MNQEQHTAMMAALEGFVDSHGLDAVVSALADICAEKATHVRENWQDKGLARTWDKAGTVLAKAAAKLPELP
jgi:hypothetical protein